MSAPPALSVIVPCLDEEDNVSRFPETLFSALERLGVSYEVIAVDDGSGDGTGERLEALRRRGLPLLPLRHERTRGLGAAVATAAAQARGEWIVTLDADMTFSPDQIALLLDAQRRTGADCVLGSPARGSFCGVPWSRRLPSAALNALYRLLFSSAITAYTPIFRLYRASLLRALKPDCAGFEVNAEIAVLLLRRDARIVEAPVVLTARVLGSSKLRRARELGAHLRLLARLLAGR